jgi:NAD(P)-dependent dehydrogenase (short-subunit alcohol dehydrogenase family)
MEITLAGRAAIVTGGSKGIGFAVATRFVGSGALKRAGLVRDRHEGRYTHYRAQLGALAPLVDWTSQMAGFWQSRFDQLEDLLKRMDQ